MRKATRTKLSKALQAPLSRHPGRPKRVAKPQPTTTPTIYFVRSSDNVRVGRSDWPGDAFNVVAKDKFDHFLEVWNGLNLPKIEDKTYEDD